MNYFFIVVFFSCSLMCFGVEKLEVITVDSLFERVGRELSSAIDAEFSLENVIFLDKSLYKRICDIYPDFVISNPSIKEFLKDSTVVLNYVSLSTSYHNVADVVFNSDQNLLTFLNEKYGVMSLNQIENNILIVYDNKVFFVTYNEIAEFAFVFTLVNERKLSVDLKYLIVD